MTQDQPLKINSMPTNVPMTQKADSGNRRQIMMPKAKVIKPLNNVQPLPEYRWLKAKHIRETPRATKNTARISV
jgi:hypothetical protein